MANAFVFGLSLAYNVDVINIEICPWCNLHVFRRPDGIHFDNKGHRNISQMLLERIVKSDAYLTFLVTRCRRLATLHFRCGNRNEYNHRICGNITHNYDKSMS
jgi:hypothetical protein